MRLTMLAAAISAMFLAAPAQAQALWTLNVSVYATGTQTIYQSTPPLFAYTPISGYYTFQRHVFAFDPASSVSLSGSYDSPYNDPLGLGEYPSFTGTFTLDGGGTNFSYHSDTCRTRFPNCSEFYLTAPTFSVAFVSSSGGPGPVPEPATWALSIVGFGAIGAAMRRRARATASSSTPMGKSSTLLLDKGI